MCLLLVLKVCISWEGHSLPLRMPLFLFTIKGWFTDPWSSVGHFFQWDLIWRNYVTIYCRAIKNRKANTSNNSSEHENEDRRCAIVLFGIVMIFLVSNIPRIVLNAYEFFVLSSECIIVPFWVYVMTSINGLCLTFNSSFNFFVYCFVNPR